ncbi:MAG: hypothetical protein AAGC47_12825 [Bacteroidota bacterium]
MKKLLILLSIFISAQAFSQSPPSQQHVSFELGSGLNFAFNDSTYFFRIGGMVQPYVGIREVGDADAERTLNSRRSYLNFGGSAIKEKVDFFFQFDFSDLNSLLDAWVRYVPVKDLSLTIGQRQTIANNREMLIMEDRLQFLDRSLLSEVYSNSGREFGLFVEYKYSFGDFAIVPQVAVTSGDGKNSFGVDSRDTDLGGFKYTGRLDVYPLGFFTEGNDLSVADLAHESSPKFVIGGAASINQGTSEAVGEGHGEFILFDELGEEMYPDYRQLYADVVFKYAGFSFLGEYNISTATNLEGTFKLASQTEELLPTEISEFLALGTGYNAQIGYTTTTGYALDFRYSGISPEFDTNPNSIVREQTGYTIGFTKYFKGNDLKVHAAFSSIDFEQGDDIILAELMFQVRF